MASAPVVVLRDQTKRRHGNEVQMENIAAGKAVADIIRTCLGPKAMLKMLLNPIGDVVLTNDGNAILREIHVQHPAAKSLIEISRSQDDEVGDGTTSVVILAGEFLNSTLSLLEDHVHPRHIISGFSKAMEFCLDNLSKKLCKHINLGKSDELVQAVKSCLGTKVSSRWSDLVCSLAIQAAGVVSMEKNGRKEIDIKRYVRVERIPGGRMEDSCVLDGIILEKDVVHTGMARKIENPRVLLLDCSLEYSKAESMMNVEVMKEEDFNRILQIEEESVENMCKLIIAHKVNVVVTEKGCSDLAQYYLQKAKISVIRRVKKTDNNRIARATGATIVNRVEDIKEEDIGNDAGLFEIKKIGDDYYTFITKCKSAKACSIVLRGASRDILKEINRNMEDALHVAKNVMLDGSIVPGGGCVEMALSIAMQEKAKTMSGPDKMAFMAAARSLEVIPKILLQNCGVNILRVLTELRAKHFASPSCYMGVDGETGKLVDVAKAGIWDSYAVRAQSIKSSFEVTMMLLKIDAIVSGTKKADDLQKK